MADTPAPLDAGERLDAQELRAWQLERLRASSRHAYTNVPHHREAFDKAGGRPEDCRSLSDLTTRTGPAAPS